MQNIFPFKIPIGNGKTTDRMVYAFLILCEKITLIDSGVSRSEKRIFDYIRQIGRDPKEISTLILSHSHPDHIGAARAIQEETQCKILAHRGEVDWIEDTSKQQRERPVPGFDSLVLGPVEVDRFLEDGEIISFGDKVAARVIHTPGHSRGSISLLFDDGKTLFTADAVLLENDLPMYEDISDSVESIRKLSKLQDVELLLSSWEEPIRGREAVVKRMEESISYLSRIHETVLEVNRRRSQELCQEVVRELSLPPFAVNPISTKAFASSLRVVDRNLSLSS